MQFPVVVWRHHARLLCRALQTRWNTVNAPEAASTTAPSGAQRRPSKPSVPVNGSAVLNFGKKHNGSTFADVVAKDPDYCQWVLKTALEGGASVDGLRLALYYAVETRTAGGHGAPAKASADQKPFVDRQPPANTTASRSSSPVQSTEGSRQQQRHEHALTMCGFVGCLSKFNFVLTGKHPTIERTVVEEGIRKFGGTVRNTVSGTTSYLVVMGARLDNKFVETDRSVQTSRKYLDARKRNTKILDDLEALCELVASEGDAKEGSEELSYRLASWADKEKTRT